MIACIVDLISLCWVVASAIEIDDAPKLNTNAWMNFPSHLQMIKPLAAPCDNLDNQSYFDERTCGLFQATQ